MGLFFSSQQGLEEGLALAVTLLLQLFPAANKSWAGIGDLNLSKAVQNEGERVPAGLGEYVESMSGLFHSTPRCPAFSKRH